MTERHFIKVDRTARVYTFGNLSERTETVWVVAHGYAMLSEYFIKKFEVLDPDVHYVIAPEGLSRAYIDGMTGRVGASWMTREMREEEIADYIAYLDTAVETLAGKALHRGARLVALGFSQGAATISRWVHHSGRNFHKMIIWGGAPAAELFSVKTFHNLSILLVFGEKDDYITFDNLERLKEQSKEKGWTFEIIRYKGGHHLDSTLISELGEKL